MIKESISNTISFEKASYKHEKLIFQWLAEPHMQEFWDNSQEHKDDILNFIHDRKQHYFAGTTKYWLGLIEAEPFCFILSDEILSSESDLPDIYREHLSTAGQTIAIDFGIGNRTFLGKGLAAPTLQKFTAFYQEQIDPLADTFFIDPDVGNLRAKHVYEKAGFEIVGNYDATKGFFVGNTGHLMVKHLAKKKLHNLPIFDYTK